MNDLPPRLVGDDLTLGYADRTIIEHLDVQIPTGELTVIVGPNACGKSTLLRALARMLNPTEGEVRLDGQPIGSIGHKAVARTLGLLPQAPVAPDAILVEDMVARGRFPHQSMWRQWTRQDQAAVDAALHRAGVDDLRDRIVTELSGGQRQRVWIAMALAQETSLLLLDEPTTYLDIAHQIEVLNLCRGLRSDGITVVAVLHELHLAFRYAGHLIVMRDGAILAQGRPADIVTAGLVEAVFDLPCQVISDPVTGSPLVIPLDPAAHDV